jgi:hypothetical protein
VAAHADHGQKQVTSGRTNRGQLDTRAHYRSCHSGQWQEWVESGHSTDALDSLLVDLKVERGKVESGSAFWPPSEAFEQV